MTNLDVVAESIRPADPTDKILIAEKLQEFANQIGDTIVIDPERVERRINRWPLVHAVDDEVGAYTELKVKEDVQEAEFTGAFPRGMDVGRIGPLFALCARNALLQLPRAAENWRVWGEFIHGQDANRIPDGGRSICLTWQRYFALAGLSVTARPQDDRDINGLWIAEMRLGDLASHGA